MSIKRKYLHINSIDRDTSSSSTSDFKILLKYAIDCKKCKLIQATIPNSYFNITDKNNTVLLNGVPSQIDIGCYTFDELVSALSGFFASVIFDDRNCRIIIGLSSSQTLSFPQPNTFYGSMHEILGFSQYYSVTSNTHVSSSGPSLDQYSLFINISELSNNYMTSNYKNSTFEIVNNVNKNGIIFFSSMTQFDQSINERDVNLPLSYLNIKVLDIYGDVVQHLPNWSMTLAFY